jgi:hypothetical protein
MTKRRGKRATEAQLRKIVLRLHRRGIALGLDPQEDGTWLTIADLPEVHGLSVLDILPLLEVEVRMMDEYRAQADPCPADHLGLFVPDDRDA